ncbi:EF-hand and coiled-coil domain-containing protein 1-like [Polyodon spathula]|uniref:EF-hand and coiled-coil domain-containing protein 1-like n=1 Tax=Polyodon spathula TaxID=7913 RepID=UPI001B7EC7D9|nr:EF-hand and coiled-coil domain-containing protein 1-like [Polyodon spathula]
MTSVPVSSSSVRPARRSEWLCSALAHHYKPDPGVGNEIVVLATGVDQYLQEIFHHLAFYSGDDLISDEDFKLLCSVLGLLEHLEVEEAGGNETRGLCSGLPRELGFREFHSRLCGYFCLRSGGSQAETRLPLAAETEHVEREIRLRWPRVRRRKCVSFDLSKDRQSVKRTCQKSGSILKLDKLHFCSDSGQQGAVQCRLEMENASLLELVEDLRSALQGSDARCLALEVAVRREKAAEPHGTSKQKPVEVPACRAARHHKGECCRGTRALLKELELIRASRDGQLEEAMRFNQRVEEELMAANQQIQQLEEAASRLQWENAEIKRKAEDARAALVNGLEKVREIQETARLVPCLQERIQELEAELQSYRFRAETPDEQVTSAVTLDPCSPPPSHRRSPTGRDESSLRAGEEHLQRAVEGRAASDEEEEERGSEEGQCCLLEVKRLLNQLSCCGRGCQSSAARQLLIAQASFHGNASACVAMTSELKGWSRRCHARLEDQGRSSESELEKLLCSTGKDLQLQEEEAEMLRMELQMVETERVRLSLLEEKLADALTLLLQLRAQNISRRALGKILLDTLDLCSKAGHGPSHSPVVLDTLCQQLLSSELLAAEPAGQAGPEQPCSTTNSLIISC